MKKLLVLLLCCMVGKAQSRYPDTLFTSPLDVAVIPSGTFGELRSNHFHSGLDIKTQGREGLPVYAIGNGYVSRIKVGHWGFGKVLYVDHPGGYTSVYAHLQKFSPAIEAYIKERQYKKESYEIELFPKADELPLEKQQLIAYTGNTGSSGGPHLHFEIRERDSQKPINPILFGLKVKDTKPPSVNGLFAYALSDSARINRTNRMLQLPLHKQKDGSFLTDTLYAEGKIGFGIDVHDSQDLTYNKNGIYALEMRVNDTLYLHYDFETFSFGETAYINTLIDYGHYARTRQRIQQCFVLPFNRLSIYREKRDNGIIHVKDSMFYRVVIKALDLGNNESVIHIPVAGKKQPLLHKKENFRTDTYLNAAEAQQYELGLVKAYFPKNTFYEDFYVDMRDNGDGTYTIHNKEVPTRGYFTLNFDVSGYSPEERKQLFIARLSEKNAPIYVSTEKNETVFTTRTKYLGTYTLASDKKPPVITPNNFKNNQWLSNYTQLSLSVTDAMSGINEYRATINGTWILMEYEPKNNTLTYHFSDNAVKEGAKHELEVVVTDNVGNQATFRSTFYRKF